MVRGRRPRAAITQSTASRGALGDEFAASPKRKDCKLDTSVGSHSPGHRARLAANANNNSSDFMGFTKTRARAITNYFPFAQKDHLTNNGAAFLKEHSENACDSFPRNAESGDDDESSNIFLQAPVLHLNIDKSPNQASSITINKHIEVINNFSALTAASNGNTATLSFVAAANSEDGGDNNDTDRSDDDGHVTRSPSLASAPESSDYISSDSNSCDSGVVADRHLELSPSKRKKPMTPHRIVCHSPAKHAVAVAEKSSPTSALSNLNINKTNPKTRRRLIANKQPKKPTAPITAAAQPQSVILPTETVVDDDVLAVALAEEIPSAIFEATPEPLIETANNNNNSQNATKATKLTDFFPVRRSVRKTKKAVEQEQLRSIEAAIRNEQQDGLVVAEFPLKGRGIMAARRFARGEFVIEYIGDLIDLTEANRREQVYAKDENTGCYMYYFKHKSQQYCIDATAESEKIGRLVNHSRNGNLVTKTVFYRNQPHLVLLAKDCIEIGEELTYDYGDRSKESLMHHPWLAL